MDKIQNVRMLISLATGSKEILTVWVNPKTVKMQREISLPVKSNIRFSKEFLQKELKETTES
jgi:hypothetical protein